MDFQNTVKFKLSSSTLLRAMSHKRHIDEQGINLPHLTNRSDIINACITTT